MDQNTFHLIITFVNLVGLGIIGVLGYLMKTTIEQSNQRMEKLESNLKETERNIVDVKVHYLPKDDFSEFKEELWRKLEDLKAIVSH